MIYRQYEKCHQTDDERRPYVANHGQHGDEDDKVEWE